MSVIIGDDPPGPPMTPERRETIRKFYEKFCEATRRSSMVIDPTSLDESIPWRVRIEHLVIPIDASIVQVRRDAIDCKTEMVYALVDQHGDEYVRVAVWLDDVVMDPSFTAEEVAQRVERNLIDEIRRVVLEKIKVGFAL